MIPRKCPRKTHFNTQGGGYVLTNHSLEENAEGLWFLVLQMTTKEISLMENNLWFDKKANKDIETKVYGFVLYVVVFVFIDRKLDT